MFGTVPFAWFWPLTAPTISSAASTPRQDHQATSAPQSIATAASAPELA